MRILKILFKGLLALASISVLTYFLGPTRSFDEVENDPIAMVMELDQIEAHLQQRETQIQGLKPNNAAAVVWADSVRQTEYSFVYLHGFSASHGEGDPVHHNVARFFGANLYLTRLPDHGVAHDSVFQHLTPRQLVDEAREAVAIGKLIGKKTILMSCSTGGTLSLYLSAADPEIHAEILLSPNIALAHPLSRALNDPWGLQLARTVGGGEYNMINYDNESQKYWTDRYRWEGTIALQELIEMTMLPNIFKKISHPVFCGYYYQDKEHQDPVVSVKAMLEMSRQLGTLPEDKQFMAFANGTNHVMLSPLKNPNWEDVQEAIIAFCMKHLDMRPANN
ncbi:MAG: alpha/beta hydrolase [Saprospiraceae bacterium]|nr:alpha/beta hydrolase [Saprospiraceae bacterium]